jgi:hypothetical protein
MKKRTAAHTDKQAEIRDRSSTDPGARKRTFRAASPSQAASRDIAPESLGTGTSRLPASTPVTLRDEYLRSLIS